MASRRLNKEIKDNLRRKRITKRTILIAFEGNKNNKTEKIYFSNFNNHNNSYYIKFANGNTTDPISMIKGLINEIPKLGIDILNGDKVYCVFDTDEKSNKDSTIKNACAIAEEHGIEIITSNPCFEEWFLCHYENSTRPLKNKECIIKLKKYIPNYDKNMNIYPEINNNTETAIKNAKIKEEFHRKQGKNKYLVESNPSTLVYKIIEELNSNKITN